MHLDVASGTLDKKDTLGNHHHTVPSSKITTSAKGNFNLDVPWQHTLSFHYLFFVSGAEDPNGPILCVSDPWRLD